MHHQTYSLLVIVVNLATETFLIVGLVLERESVVLETVARLNALTGGLVLIGVLLGFLNHALNLFRAETALVVGDGDALALASALVTCANLEDSVGVKLEGDLNLRNTTWGGGNTSQLELSELVVVLCHGALAFEDLDQDHGLVVGGGREDLGLLGGDGGTTLDQVGHDTASSLDTKSKRVDIHEDEVLSLGIQSVCILYGEGEK